MPRKKSPGRRIAADVPGLSWWPREPENAEQLNREHRAKFARRIDGAIDRAVQKAVDRLTDARAMIWDDAIRVVAHGGTRTVVSCWTVVRVADGDGNVFELHLSTEAGDFPAAGPWVVTVYHVDQADEKDGEPYLEEIEVCRGPTVVQTLRSAVRSLERSK